MAHESCAGPHSKAAFCLSSQAIDELCLKPKNMRDLLTDEPFTRKDIIHIQDPLNLQVGFRHS